jgi:hypothetical protein
MRDHDPVNHPSHYTGHPSGVECITITEHMGFLLGSAMKYIWRCDLKKDAIEDLKKARWYLDREIANREKTAALAAMAAKPTPSTLTMDGKKYEEISVDEALRYLKVDERQKRTIPRYYETDKELGSRLAKERALRETTAPAQADQSDDQGALDLASTPTS